MYDCKPCFDSILVRLKENPSIQTGTTSHVFRFHTGSIKRHADWVAELYQEGFDSILVRLKVPYVGISFTDSDMFRFHTGSIKRYAPRTIQNAWLSFRFHTGSIKSS